MSEADAIDALEELGLRTYEARCFVALTQLSEGTAKEISQVADVPQSRVYDVVEQLHRLGLVDVQASDPRRYAVVSVDVARERLRQEYRDHLETATTNLRDLERRTTEGDGVWKVADQRDLSHRTTAAVENATSEIYLLVADGDLLEPALLEALAAARDRGVAVFVEVPSASARHAVREAVETARVSVTDFAFDSKGPAERSLGRLLFVDRETVVISALTEGLVPRETAETGIWSSERGHGLIVWFRYVLEERLATVAFETGGPVDSGEQNGECTACEE
ncbi:TrmB family transcriptional regulator [Natrinema versiforme]|uniref:TrmB family transcriptional regulator n=1 Tax=Natrinema versiforme JCM 10478 TaxID=1227496 RepID=L9XUZ5_9EURY|nr:helix-turn-helix domain-containing protein [Natrinema versiforme]ELY64443.1 TrmB family transcriptional regulator [Natrinema versiforme JCM 10478]